MAYYDPDIAPSTHFETIIDLYEQDFENYWGLDEPEPEVEHGITYHKLDEFARRVVDASRTLSDERRGDASLEKVWESTSGLDDSIATFLSHRFELAFASDLMWGIHEVAGRAEQLLGYLVRVKNERARAYLHRVATCYLRGLETETLVMAGAVLEAAIEDACPDDVVRENVPNLQGKKYLSMQDRLNYLTTLDNIDYPVIERAGWLWDHRGSAVHQAPGLEAEIDEVLEALVVVLNGLEGVGGRPT